jgi:hypothetical protein
MRTKIGYFTAGIGANENPGSCAKPQGRPSLNNPLLPAAVAPPHKNISQWSYTESMEDYRLSRFYAIIAPEMNKGSDQFNTVPALKARFLLAHPGHSVPQFPIPRPAPQTNSN